MLKEYDDEKINRNMTSGRWNSAPVFDILAAAIMETILVEEPPFSI